jgi:hypothetical protein
MRAGANPVAGARALFGMPKPQRATLVRVACMYPPGATWHWADCGCCVCFHPGGDRSCGWLIDADGGAAGLGDGTPYKDPSPAASSEEGT